MNDVTFTKAQQAKAISSFKNTKGKLCMTEPYIFVHVGLNERLMLITSLKIAPWCRNM